MPKVLAEVTSLSPKDCFHIVERHKTEFNYPLHEHKEFELNFIQNGEGVRRVVGDHTETIGPLELVLIGGEGIEHAWEQHECKSKDIREITIHFSPDLISGPLLEKNQFASIRRMFERASCGLAFPFEAILKVYGRLDFLAVQEDSFIQFLNFLYILYELSLFDSKVLASSAFAKAEDSTESRRVTQVKDFIKANYAREIPLHELAELVKMAPSAFSRFFKGRTGSTVSSYITDIRLGHAARDLVDTTNNIADICYSCGFNNLSNFNRTFKERRGVTPKEFRQLYKKTKVVV